MMMATRRFDASHPAHCIFVRNCRNSVYSARVIGQSGLVLSDRGGEKNAD